MIALGLALPIMWEQCECWTCACVWVAVVWCYVCVSYVGAICVDGKSRYMYIVLGRYLCI